MQFPAASNRISGVAMELPSMSRAGSPRFDVGDIQISLVHDVGPT